MYLKTRNRETESDPYPPTTFSPPSPKYTENPRIIARRTVRVRPSSSPEQWRAALRKRHDAPENIRQQGRRGRLRTQTGMYAHAQRQDMISAQDPAPSHAGAAKEVRRQLGGQEGVVRCVEPEASLGARAADPEVASL